MRNHQGYSLVEVLVAVVVVGIGLTAAAIMVGAIMSNEELNQVSLRAANLQEQSVTLCRLGLEPGVIASILPEVVVSGAVPPSGGFSIDFTTEEDFKVVINGGTNSLKQTACTVVFPNPPPVSGQVTYGSNTVTVLLPSIR